MIGDAGGREFCVPVRNTRGKDKSAGGVKRKRKCPNCSRYGGEHMYECGGQGGGAARCDYFDLAGGAGVTGVIRKGSPTMILTSAQPLRTVEMTALALSMECKKRFQ